MKRKTDSGVEVAVARPLPDGVFCLTVGENIWSVSSQPGPRIAYRNTEDLLKDGWTID